MNGESGTKVPDLKSIGWDTDVELWANETDPENSLMRGRIAQVSRGYSLVFVDEEAILCESDRNEHDTTPATGDFVLVDHDSELGPTIVELFPRRTELARRAPGRVPRPQVLAANHDYVFVMDSLDRELNIRRLERQLVLATQAGTEPVIVLTKADLAENVEETINTVSEISDAKTVVCSAVSKAGLDELLPFYQKGKTAVLMGVSGVGKSTLVNAISKGAVQRTGAVRATDNRGRHTTVTRDLIPIPGQGCVIDTPGIREMGLWQSYSGLDSTFSDVTSVAAKCRFSDCVHIDEPACAVNEAIDDGTLPVERVEHWRELASELHLQEEQIRSHAQKSETKIGAESRRRKNSERSTKTRRLKKKSKRNRS